MQVEVKEVLMEEINLHRIHQLKVEKEEKEVEEKKRKEEKRKKELLMVVVEEALINKKKVVIRMIRIASQSSSRIKDPVTSRTIRVL